MVKEYGNLRRKEEIHMKSVAASLPVGAPKRFSPISTSLTVLGGPRLSFERHPNSIAAVMRGKKRLGYVAHTMVDQVTAIVKENKTVGYFGYFDVPPPETFDPAIDTYVIFPDGKTSNIKDPKAIALLKGSERGKHFLVLRNNLVPATQGLAGNRLGLIPTTTVFPAT